MSAVEIPADFECLFRSRGGEDLVFGQNGQIIQGVLHGPDLFVVVGGLKSDLTNICLINVGFRKTTASLSSRRWCMSDAVSVTCVFPVFQ